MRQLSHKYALRYVVSDIPLPLHIESQRSTQIAMHPLTLPCAQNVACLKISFACALVSKTQWNLIDDLEHALLEAGAITVSAGADQHQFVRAHCPQWRGPLLAVQSRKLAYNEHPARGKERIVSGSSVLQERLSCSESTP